jgi:hypothetical protein
VAHKLVPQRHKRPTGECHKRPTIVAQKLVPNILCHKTWVSQAATRTLHAYFHQALFLCRLMKIVTNSYQLDVYGIITCLSMALWWTRTVLAHEAQRLEAPKGIFVRTASKPARAAARAGASAVRWCGDAAWVPDLVCEC